MAYTVRRYTADEKPLFKTISSTNLISQALEESDGLTVHESCVSLVLAQKEMPSIPIRLPQVPAGITINRQQQTPSPLPAEDEAASFKGKFVVLLAYRSTTYKLFSAHSVEEAEVAYDKLLATLQLLSAVPMNELFLRSVILPKPKLHQDMAAALVQYIKTHHSTITLDEWNALVGITINNCPLAYHACVMNEPRVLKRLVVKSDHTAKQLLFYHPLTRDTLLHVAVPHGSLTVKRVLKYLARSSAVTYWQIAEYISQTNQQKPPSPNGFTRSTSKRFSLPSAEDAVQRASSLKRQIATSIGLKSGSRSTSVIEVGGCTPLMMGCREGDSRAVLYLLLDGADPNVRDPTSDTTALHIAASQGNHNIIRLLLAFEAELEPVNKNGDTPLDLLRQLEDVPERIKSFETVKELRDRAKETLQENVPQFIIGLETEADGIHVLSLDGGGTRGIMSLYSLIIIEKKMRYLSQSNDLHIADYFDWFAGTSVGSIMTIAMTHNNCSAIAAMKTIIHNLDNVFQGKRPYNPDSAEVYLKKMVGDKDLKAFSEPRVMLTTTLVDTLTPKLVRLTNYRENDKNDHDNWKAWEAARASASAPVYFTSFEGKYIDGGVYAANPTLLAINEVHHYEKDKKLSFILNLGCGRYICDEPPKAVDITKPNLSVNLISDMAKSAHALSYLFLKILPANIHNAHYTADLAEGWCSSIGASFHCLSPVVHKDLPLDTREDDDVAYLIFHAYIHCLENTRTIEKVARKLLARDIRHAIHTEV